MIRRLSRSIIGPLRSSHSAPPFLTRASCVLFLQCPCARLYAHVELVQTSENDLRHELQSWIEELNTLEAPHESTEELGQLHLRQQVADAVMQPWSEDQGLAVVTLQVKLIGVRVDARIAIAGSLHQVQGIAGANGLTVPFEVLGRDTRLCRGHGGKAHDLIHAAQA